MSKLNLGLDQAKEHTGQGDSGESPSVTDSMLKWFEKKCIHIYFLIKGDIRNGEKSWDNEVIRATSQLFGASNFIPSLIETTKGKKPEITLPFFVLSGQRENTHSDSESWISIPCIGVIPKSHIFSHINYTVDPNRPTELSLEALQKMEILLKIQQQWERGWHSLNYILLVFACDHPG